MKPLIIVEGETDTLTLIYHGYAALGLPGAMNVKCLKPEHVASFDTVLVVSEPDVAGQKFPTLVADHLRDSGYLGRVLPLAMGPTGYKDPSALHCADPDKFKERFDTLIKAALELKESLQVDKSKKVTIPVRAPFPLVDAFLREYGMVAEGRVLHHWDGRWWAWNQTKYIERSADDQRAILGQFLRDRVELTVVKGDRVAIQEPTSWDLNNALDALKTLANLPQNQNRPPVWLRDEKSPLTAFPPNGEAFPKLVSCPNGIVELGSGTLRPSSPRWFAMDALATNYDPNAECPEWLKFLDQAWSDQASRDTLQEIFGYLLTPDMSQQKAFLIVGPPRSGKGTIGRVIQALLGPDAVTRPALADFGQSFGLEPLIGKSVAIVSDARLDANVPAGMLAERLLAISGEDTINIQRKYASAWSGPLAIRFLVLANEIPRFRDASGALPKRFITLRMTKSWLGNEDLELFGRLRNELSGILNWSIEGWRRLQERGQFVQPESSREDVEDLIDQANPLLEFLEMECERHHTGQVPKAQLYKRYLEWCEQFKTRQLAMPTFFRDLKSTWPEIRTVRGHGSAPRELTGIRLLSEWDKAELKTRQPN